MLSLVADLEDHSWYVDVVSALIADVESYLGRWAAFEEYVGEPVV